ncbi:hypothetical protein ASG43_16520 [Aureimonas sp. Leaf454]|uniref:tRNA (adenosine(37)-N6)-threonylcarbamoyltransferase complex dimerization subunit type 1 TsaB n=1 Tax=Aureimonas sp. Leaf454 TaxID=1736381 RepID=UPI0006FC288B|nr:tRNA (adenosine(37)-N6)-threonylcarbamoyltransferase complex dimerization subunit type 1 TsaB [Aureimonas sp. Leaf454]KQT43113.1 hypothetical protein ASG43_16520 [Aureimonas sp. Leaf454]
MAAGRDLLLAIDTAGSRCAACLFDIGGNRVLSRGDPDIGKGHAERLMDDIADRLREAGAGYGDLSRLAVVVGPGSFTGLRVGVAAARGLSLALKIPAVGIGTLEALAEPHADAGVPVLAVLDAKRGELYAAFHGADGSEIAAPRAVPPEALAGMLSPLPDGAPLLVTGSGSEIALEALAGRWAIRLASAPHPDIASVARLGARRETDHAPSPLYLRGADAKAPTREPIARRVA